MTHADDADSTAHKALTWIGIAGFAVGVLLIPVGNYVFETSIDPLYAGVVVAASLVAVGSQRVTDKAAELIKAWRSGGR